MRRLAQSKRFLAAASLVAAAASLLLFLQAQMANVDAQASPPPAPAGLTATAGDGSVALSWDDPSDSAITGYEYQYRHEGVGWGEWISIPESGPSTTSHTVTKLENGMEYRFHLRARNANGPSDSAPDFDPWYVAATPAPVLPPATPESVSVTRGDGHLDVSWDAVDGATSYHITYSSDDGASWSLAALNHPDPAITIANVANDATYIVGVRARNSGGDSGWRNSPPAGPFVPTPTPEPRNPRLPPRLRRNPRLLRRQRRNPRLLQRQRRNPRLLQRLRRNPRLLQRLRRNPRLLQRLRPYPNLHLPRPRLRLHRNPAHAYAYAADAYAYPPAPTPTPTPTPTPEPASAQAQAQDGPRIAALTDENIVLDNISAATRTERFKVGTDSTAQQGGIKFTTGDSPFGGYEMDNVSLLFDGQGGASGTISFEVSLRKEDPSNSGQPTADDKKVLGTELPDAPETITYTSASAIQLDADTDYWIWLSATVTGGTDKYVKWHTTESNDDGGVNGWALADKITKCTGNCTTYDSTTEDYAGSITIKARDKGKALGVTLTTPASGQIAVSWTAVTSADGYKVQWKSGNEDWSSTRQNTVTSGTTTTSTISNLTVGTDYDVRVIATKGAKEGDPSDTHTLKPGQHDYDTDNDNLIEVNTLVKLDAIRYDLDGDGTPSAGDETGYATGFPNPITGMGCAATCKGYELTASLDFDTNSNGKADSGDSYWNSGNGWQPIADFHAGDSDNREPTTTTPSPRVRRRRLHHLQPVHQAHRLGSRRLTGSEPSEDLRVRRAVRRYRRRGQGERPQAGETSGWTSAAPARKSPPHVYVGGLAGRSAGTITGVSITGIVRGVSPSATGTPKPPTAGGLVGYNDGGTITASYAASADVTANQQDTQSNTISYAGGLVGYNNGGTIQAAHSAGTATATINAALFNGKLAYAGGLVGYHKGGEIRAAYSYSVPTAANVARLSAHIRTLQP